MQAARIGQCLRAMLDPILIWIAAVFALAGFVKGVIGLGLPTVSMGLLAVTMTPVQALTIVIVPAIVTNIWQTFVGPYLRDIIRRLWPLMIGTVIGIWSGAGLMTGLVAMIAAFAGMFLGQAVRTRMRPEAFRRWFLIAMLVLGLYLAGNAIVG